MATNNFKPFAAGTGANVTAQADYEALAALVSGFTAGKASSAQVNKALRQSTVLASVLAQFIANTTGKDVLDNGDTTTLLNNLITALKTNGALSFLQTANNFSEIKSAGTTAVSAALANLGSSDGTLMGRLLNIKTFATSGSYTATTGTKKIIVKMVGGGGSGASGPVNISGYQSGGGGGASGCYLEFSILISALTTPVSITIGAGGSGVSNSAGIMGGTTSFGSYASVLGGFGGQILASTNSASVIYGMSGSRGVGSYTLSSSATLIDYDYGNISGDATITANGERGGFGAASRIGSSVLGGGVNTIGMNATTHGSGGGGTVSNSATTVYASGAGFSGYMIIEEYA
ncbi:hypothetical protein [Sodalis ligni]|uniref:Glycine-rich domain-containing protein n=1 Tax=Sodalis ligni TaxID=2697027 RepID=A0A4R1NBV5_9GAMM|nr:hypothetical protein [Sodalis ligni]TCL04209.1 hypothetical protein EZJ58_2320 [Sodalis ligni]